MTKFGTKGTVVTEPKGLYIRPGINKDVQIVSVEGLAPEGGSPALEFTFKLVTSPDEATTKVRFFMSEKAEKKSLEKIKHLATKVVTEEQLDAVGGDDIVSYGTALNKLLAGKTVKEMKFNGEEYKNASGEVKSKAVIGLPKFASATVGELKYDASNSYDFKKLEVADVDGSFMGVPQNENKSQLPF